MSFCDFDGPKFFSGKWHKARKEHKCIECHQPILKGEKYGAFSGMWDRDVQTFKQHLECEDACVFIRDMQGECLCFGELLENEVDWCDRSRKVRKPELRALMARVKWRKHKGRPLAWIPFDRTKVPSMVDLDVLRARGRT